MLLRCWAQREHDHIASRHGSHHCASFCESSVVGMCPEIPDRPVSTCCHSARNCEPVQIHLCTRARSRQRHRGN